MFDRLILKGKDINWGRNKKPIIVGIYKITNPKGKIYIGQSWNIFNRWKDYKTYKGKGQPLLQRSFLNHGIDNHDFEIVCILSKDVNQQILDYHEIIYWQSYLYSNFKMLNLKEPGSFGKMSQSSKDKIGKANSLSLLGKKQSEEAIKKRIASIMATKRNGKNKIVQYSLNGEKIKEWDCIIDAAKQLNIPDSNICKCLINSYGRNSAGGFRWAYYEKPIKTEKIKNKNRIKRAIYQYNVDGSFIKEWESASKASKETKINRANIIMCALGNQKTAGNFKWAYKDGI